jgi:hypothetical protein
MLKSRSLRFSGHLLRLGGKKTKRSQPNNEISKISKYARGASQATQAQMRRLEPRARLFHGTGGVQVRAVAACVDNSQWPGGCHRWATASRCVDMRLGLPGDGLGGGWELPVLERDGEKLKARVPIQEAGRGEQPSSVQRVGPHRNVICTHLNVPSID